MLIYCTVASIFLGLLLSWQPAMWGVGVFQLSIFAVATVTIARQLRGSQTFVGSPDLFAVCLLACWGPAQIACNRSVYAYDTWNASVQWLTLCTVYLLARSLLQSREARRDFIIVMTWAGGVLCIFSVISHFGSPQRVFGLFQSRYSPYGPFVYQNQFAAFVELILPLAFFRATSAKRGRIVHSAVFAALFACVVASLSRAGFLIAVVETGVCCLLTWRRRLISGSELLKFGIPVLLLTTIFALIVGSDPLFARFGIRDPLQVREGLAAATVQMIEARPLVGFGLGTWPLVYPEYATFDVAAVANQAHNDWLQWASEGGVTFAMLLLSLAIWFSRLAWKQIWGLGVPAVFVHCLVDYPTRLPALAGALFMIAGALAASASRNPERAKSNIGKTSHL